MAGRGADSPRVLIIYYSFSGQTRGIIHRLAAGLEEAGVTVLQEKLSPLSPPRFPLGTIPATVKMMIETFVRRRFPIHELDAQCFEPFDLVILAGPTWSYNPSGPVLALFTQYGRRLFEGRQVLPLISCRGYWRLHWFGLKRLLLACGAVVPNVVVFSHPAKEPWRTIGVFLKLAGKTPEKAWFSRHYPRYGHSREQQEEAGRFGVMIGRALRDGAPLDTLSFRSETALP